MSEEEGRRLTQIVRRGRGHPIRVRRATIILASASGTLVPAIARLVAADEDTVRDVIHAFNDRGLAALDPRWAGGGPRLVNDDDLAFIVTTAKTRPETLGRPFTHCSVRKLAAYLRRNDQRVVRVGHERLRQLWKLTDSRESSPVHPISSSHTTASAPSPGAASSAASAVSDRTVSRFSRLIAPSCAAIAS